MLIILAFKLKDFVFHRFNNPYRFFHIKFKITILYKNIKNIKYFYPFKELKKVKFIFPFILKLKTIIS